MFSDSAKVLLVDDDDVDVRVVKRAFRSQRINNEIVVAHDGIEALQMLRGQNGFDRLGMPVLILLDLNMPRMGGLEFLRELRSDPSLHQTIVFVMTTSDDQRDRDAAYDKHVAGYLLKSECGVDLMRQVPLLENFLLNVQFPRLQYSNDCTIDTPSQTTIT